MSKREKLLKRFLSKPKDFRVDELRVLLRGYGYEEVRTGKTAGSRVAFFSRRIQHIIRLHKPHPSHVLKKYQLDYVEEILKTLEIIK